MAGLGDLRDYNDANCTYEGENNVLLQQTSNWLLQLWHKKISTKEGPICTVLGSANFLTDLDKILTTRFTARTEEEAVNPQGTQRVLLILNIHNEYYALSFAQLLVCK